MKGRTIRNPAILMAVLLMTLACLPGPVVPPTPTRTVRPAGTTIPTLTKTPIEPTASPAAEAGPPQPAAPPHFPAGALVTVGEIRMIDANAGWALSGPYVLVTADGGESWQERTPPQPLTDPETPTAHAAFLDAQTAWVIFAQERQQIPPDASVWSTTDGGVTWRASPPLNHEAYGDAVWAEFAAYGTELGWLMMRGVYVGAGTHYGMQMLHSTDGGLTWSSQPGADIGIDYTSLKFADAMTGWMSWQSLGAWYGGPPQYGVTVDGGGTWLGTSLPPPVEAPGLFDEYIYSEPYRVNLLSADSVRLLVGVYNYGSPPEEFLGYLYSTEDGGATWQIHPLPAGVFPENYDLLFFDSENALLLGRDSYQTTDGGASWQHVSTVYWDGQYSFVDPQNGWAAVHMEEEQALVRTRDGGANWAIIPAVIAP